MASQSLKEELVNELSFLVGLQEKLWRYHPNNPDSKDIADEYIKLQIEIEEISCQLDGLS